MKLGLPKCGNVLVLFVADLFLLAGLGVWAKVSLTKELDKVVIKPCTITTQDRKSTRLNSSHII